MVKNTNWNTRYTQELPKSKVSLSENSTYVFLDIVSAAKIQFISSKNFFLNFLLENDLVCLLVVCLFELEFRPGTLTVLHAHMGACPVSLIDNTMS